VKFSRKLLGKRVRKHINIKSVTLNVQSVPVVEISKKAELLMTALAICTIYRTRSIVLTLYRTTCYRGNIAFIVFVVAVILRGYRGYTALYIQCQCLTRTDTDLHCTISFKLSILYMKLQLKSHDAHQLLHIFGKSLRK